MVPGCRYAHTQEHRAARAASVCREGAGPRAVGAARLGGIRMLDIRGDAQLAALTCSKPSAGHSVWALQTLAGKQLHALGSISDETLRPTLGTRPAQAAPSPTVAPLRPELTSSAAWRTCWASTPGRRVRQNCTAIPHASTLRQPAAEYRALPTPLPAFPWLAACDGLRARDEPALCARHAAPSQPRLPRTAPCIRRFSAQSHVTNALQGRVSPKLGQVRR